MFWKTDQPHGLPHSPFKSCVVPRPVGWISTIGADGVANLAPYSFFNAVSENPMIVMFSGGVRAPGDPKDSIANAEASGEFVCSMVSYELADAMVQTSAAVGKDVDEAAWAGIEMEPSELVNPMRVKASPIHLECVYLDKKVLPTTVPGRASVVCFGEVVGIHIRDEFLKDGIVDVGKIRPMARLGYLDYTSVESVFPIERPKAGGGPD